MNYTKKLVAIIGMMVAGKVCATAENIENVRSQLKMVTGSMTRNKMKGESVFDSLKNKTKNLFMDKVELAPEDQGLLVIQNDTKKDLKVIAFYAEKQPFLKNEKLKQDWDSYYNSHKNEVSVKSEVISAGQSGMISYPLGIIFGKIQFYSDLLSEDTAHADIFGKNNKGAVWLDDTNQEVEAYFVAVKEDNKRLLIKQDDIAADASFWAIKDLKKEKEQQKNKPFERTWDKKLRK